MSAAVNNLCDSKEFTRAYEGLLRHYQVRGQKAQAGQANENGDVEQRHHRFKQAVDQALMFRGSRDFPSVAAYQLFVDKLFTRLNAGREERYLEESGEAAEIAGATTGHNASRTGTCQSGKSGDGLSELLFGT
jgi:hypothetical protein